MENAVIGVFDDYEHARNAADALVEAGFRKWAVQISPQQEAEAARETALDDKERYSSSSGWSIGNFFRSLFGLDSDHEHAHVYHEAMRRGSFLVTVEAEREDDVDKAREVMGQFHPIDIEERAAHWRARGWSRYEAGSPRLSDEEIKAERDSYAAMPGNGGQRGNDNVRSFSRTRGGASPGGGSDVGGIHGGGITGDRPAAEVNQALGPSDAAGSGGSGLLSGADALRSEDASVGRGSMTGSTSTGMGAAAAGVAGGAARPGSMSDMAAMSGGLGSDTTGMAADTRMPNPAAGSRAESGMTTGSHAADTQMGVGARHSHEMGGMQAQAQQGSGSGAQHSYQQSADLGGGAGFGAGDKSPPTGSGGTLGSLGAGNADLHESARQGQQGMSPGSMMGDSMGAGNFSAQDQGGNQGGAATMRSDMRGDVAASGMLGGAAGDRLREEVMGGESLGRDTMGSGRPGSTHEAIGAGSSSGDPSSLGALSGTDTARQSESVFDQNLGRQTAAGVHTADEESGTMDNAAQRDSTAPDIYHVDHDADYRTHWQKAFHMEGRYEEFEPAYRYGAELRNNDAFKGYHHWNEVEPEARRDWESDQSRSPWEKAKEAVRHGWERIKE